MGEDAHRQKKTTPFGLVSGAPFLGFLRRECLETVLRMDRAAKISHRSNSDGVVIDYALLVRQGTYE